MPRRLRNWNHRYVTRFLRRHGFAKSPYPRRGSHMNWVHERDGAKIISIHYTHSGKSYSPKSMRIIIKRSGIGRDRWLNKEKI